MNEPNVKQAIPFFRVSNIDVSVRYYIDGLGFRMTKNWTVDGSFDGAPFNSEGQL